MHPLSDFSKFIGAGLSAVPRVMVDRQILESAIEFCEKSWIHKTIIPVTVEAVDVDVDMNSSVDIDLTSAGDTVEPIALSGLAINGDPKETERLVMSDHYADFSKIAVSGRYYYDFPHTRTIRVWPFSITSSVTVAIQVAFRPKETATELDDLLYDKWRQGILDGARSELYDQPDANWYKPAASAKFRKRFIGAITRAKMLPPGSRVQIPKF